MRTLKNFPDASLVDFRRGGCIGKALYFIKIDDSIIAVVEEVNHDSEKRLSADSICYLVYFPYGDGDALPASLDDIALCFTVNYDYLSFWRDIIGCDIRLAVAR